MLGFAELALVLLVGTPVFIGPEAAAKQVANEPTVIIDARGSSADAPYLPNAVVLDWIALRDGWGRTGRLDDDITKLDAAVEAAGVSNDSNVLVYGAMAQGFGEEGRIWWMLRYLGVERVMILDGGVQAWMQLDLPSSRHPAKDVPPGKLSVRLQPELRSEWRATDKARASIHDRVIDVRSPEEYLGATPYWAKRGGHIPGAVHVDWRGLVGTNGRLRPADQIRRRLALLGARTDTRIITYCTGGVRSAFAMAALAHAGFTEISNYDGSWYDWSSRSNLPVSK